MSVFAVLFKTLWLINGKAFDPAYVDKLFAPFQRLDASARAELIRELMKIDYDQGGYLIPVYFPSVEGMSAKVNGDTENITGFPVNGSNGLQDVWMQS